MSMQPQPSAADLLAAVAAWLQAEAVPGLDGAASFHARVALAAVLQIERELRADPSHHDPDRRALSLLLGEVPSTDPEQDRELLTRLAAQIRDGVYDDRGTDVATALRGLAMRRLAISNPSHLR